jgi:hypothetical protein
MASMTWEEWHAFITTHLGAPVVEETADDGATWFTSGDPGEVMVRLKGVSVAVFEYTVERQDRRAVVTPTRVGTLHSRGIDDTRAMTIVAALIDATRERRVARFLTCEYCERRIPPEWMADAQACQSCAGAHRGAVH